MLIEFNPSKDAANLTWHGVSLALADKLDWDATLVWNCRRKYGCLCYRKKSRNPPFAAVIPKMAAIS
jgi:hypothetical protein